MDYNDLRYFALIVEHGGFSAAERRTHITKSKLSRRIALLEQRLGARLLQRSTRRLALTEAGRVFYEHCAAMIVEAEAAQQAIELLRSEPSGSVRLTCPLAMAQFSIAPLVAEFMRRHPKVRVEFDATDRMVNLLEERVDVALRARDSGLRDPGLTARRIVSGKLALVASPAHAAAASVERPEQVAEFDTIGALAQGAEQVWSLVSADGGTARIAHRPRLLCSDFSIQFHATLAGIGIALLPLRIAGNAIEDGSLVRLAEPWSTPEQDIHLVFVNRRGMLPSVRALVDFLVERAPAALAY